MQMKNKKIKDHSISQESFELQFDSKNESYVTQFSDWDRLQDYYQSENYISHTDGQRNWFEKMYQLVKRFTIQKKWKLVEQYHANQIQNVLDIGCGTGDFLKYGAVHKNIQGVGVEPNTQAKSYAETKNIKVYATLQDLPNEQFDVITLWHVLEHVPNIEEYISLFQEKLSPNGVLCIAVPNFKSYDAAYYGNYWAAWDVPRHLWHFSKNSMKKIFQPHGFTLIHIEPMYFDSFYVSLLSEEYKAGKKNILKAFYIGLLSNWKAKKTKEYSSHIYLFKKT